MKNSQCFQRRDAATRRRRFSPTAERIRRFFGAAALAAAGFALAGGAYAKQAQTSCSQVEHNRGVENVAIVSLDQGRMQFDATISGAGPRLAARDLSMDLVVSVNDRRTSAVPVAFDSLPPETDGTAACAGGNGKPWCIGKCGQSGSFSCKTIVSSSAPHLYCVCSVLTNSTGSLPAPEPGDILSFSAAPARGGVEEIHPSDDDLKFVYVDARADAPIWSEAGDTVTVRINVPRSVKNIRVSESSIRADGAHQPVTSFARGREVEIIFLDDRLQKSQRGGQELVTITGAFADGTRFIGATKLR